MNTEKYNMLQNKIKTPLQNLNETRQPPAPNFKVDLREISSLIQVVDTAPTGIPKTFFDSIKLYSNGGTYEVHFYLQNVGWKKATLT